MRISRTTFLLLSVDLVTACAMMGLALWIRLLAAEWHGSLAHYVPITIALIILLPLCMGAFNLYASIAFAPPQEIKRSSHAVSLAYFMLTMFLFMTQFGGAYSRFVVLAAWLLTLFALPFARAFVRRRVCSRPWFGRRFVLIGRTNAVRELLDSMRANAARGYKPVAIVLPDERDAADTADFTDIPCFTGPNACALAAADSPSSYGVLTLADLSKETEHALTNANIPYLFSSIVLMPAFGGQGSYLWVSALDMGKSVGLLVRQNLLNPFSMRMKRLTDLVLTILGGLVISPVFLLLMLAVRLDSPGPVFFRQARIGKDGKIIKIFKFRTMYYHKSRRLQDYLDKSPELAREWAENQKLRNDPRVTRLGALLRRSSMDELPQLINVLKGEMSLVGPRPIVTAEKEKYGENFAMYTRVLPGITGLWQVSGRNDTSYGHRVELDIFYVCNWSIWMDIWILLRTIPTLLGRKGAY